MEESELWKVRNFHQSFDHGFVAGMIHTGLQMVTGGRGLRNRYQNQPGHTRMRQLQQYYDGNRPAPAQPDYDGKLTFDKLTDVYNSGTDHDEDQPVHLVVLDPNICHPRCTARYGNPCNSSVPLPCTKWLRRDRATSSADQCLQLRSLKRATLSTPTKRSIGSHPKAAAVQATNCCDCERSTGRGGISLEHARATSR